MLSMCAAPQFFGGRIGAGLVGQSGRFGLLAGVPLGWVTDRLVGEPPTVVHPVARFGAAMDVVERTVYADRRRNGVAYVATGVGLGVGAGLAARLLGRSLGARAAASVAATGVSSWLAMAGRMLETECRSVADALADDDLDEARRRVGMLVGRRTDELDEVGIARAAIETLAENTTDATVATLFWGVLGGAVGAATHRCINTMDAVVGHRNARFERFGWAAARLDDAANWVPARLTAAAVIAARPRRAGVIVRTIRRDAGQHPSPNGGVAEAAFAGALGVQLGGANDYGGVIDDRGVLGDGPAPSGADIECAAVLARDTAVAALVMTTAAQAVWLAWAARRRQRR